MKKKNVLIFGFMALFAAGLMSSCSRPVTGAVKFTK